MALKFLQESPDHVLEKLAADLSFIDSDIDLTEYNNLTLTKLNREIAKIEEALTERRKNSTYGSWLLDEKYTRDTLVIEAIKTIAGQKRSLMREERLIPGMAYYTNVTRFGKTMQGHKCVFTEAGKAGWMPFRESVSISKALQVMRHGTEADFREIYVGMADGRPDALNTVSMEHIIESSKEALALIEEYCDARWEGPWAWEVEAPEKLKMIIERREERNMQKIEQMQRKFSRMLREFDEGTMNQFEMVAASTEMMARVDSMISDLGKLSSSGIEVMAQAKSMGDDHMVEPLQQALGEPLNNAVTALTDLKAALTSATNTITGQGPTMDTGGDPAMDGGDDLGSPGDAMGGDPMMGGDPALDDVELGGDEEERVMKDI